MNEKSRALHRMKRLATSCLFVAFVLRVGATFLPPSAWLPYLKAFSEAAVIGGLADWFAVTALFRHPLGIPLPHTRILANNQTRIAESLGHFVTDNFLHPSLLTEKISHYHLSVKIAEHLEANAAPYAQYLLDIAPSLLRKIHTPELETSLSSFAKNQLAQTTIAPLIGKNLEPLTPHIPQATQGALEFLHHFVDTNHPTLHAWIHKNLPLPEKFIGIPLGSLRETLATAIATEALERLQKNLSDALANPDHPFASLISQQLEKIPTALQQNASVIQKGEALKQTALNHLPLERFFQHILNQGKQLLDAPSASTHTTITKLIHNFSREILDSPAQQEVWNKRISTFIQPILHNATPHLQAHIQQTVTAWDSNELTHKLELEVGRDLQFVRLNGTLVGGILGLALHSFLQLIG